MQARYDVSTRVSPRNSCEPFTLINFSVILDPCPLCSFTGTDLYTYPAAAWACHKFHLQQKPVVSSKPDKADVAHCTIYLRSVDYFLECANHASTLSAFPADDLETIRANMQDVLTDLTRILLEMFEKGQARTTIEWTYLDDVMRKLGDLDDASVKRCIPNELVLKFSDLVEKLAWGVDNDDNEWGGGQIQRSAFKVKANIDRVKHGKPGTT